jgi:hypothetical protein
VVPPPPTPKKKGLLKVRSFYCALEGGLLCPPKKGCLRLDPSIVPSFVVKATDSLERVFGGLRLP